jgi:hypothetical protein
MGFLIAVYENIYDLLVEDGSIAIGTIVALVVVGLWSWAMPPHSSVADLGGPLLFLLLMALLVSNLYRTGRAAARKRLG